MNTKHAFSLVELLVSLLIISIITAAFVPIISKKINADKKTISQSVTTTKNCSVHNLPSSCSLCYKDTGSNDYKCLKCDAVCSSGFYKDVETCTCKSCSSSEAVSNCAICTEAKKCIKCRSGYGLNITSCDYCEAGTYSDGSTKCQDCPEDNYCLGGSTKSVCPTNSSTNSTTKVKEKSGCKCNDGYYNYWSYYYPNDTKYKNYVSCYLCPSGSYCNATSGRKTCDFGQTSPSGSTSKGSCYCRTGFLENINTDGTLNSCTACADGYYKRDYGGNNVSCYSCNLANCLKCSTTSTTSDVKCDECNNGYFVDKNGACSKIPDIWEPANFQVTHEITVVAAGENCTGSYCCWNLSNVGVQRTVCTKAAANKICSLYGAQLISDSQVNAINSMPAITIANYLNEHQICIYSAISSYGVNCIYKLIISGCNGASDNSCRPTRFHMRDGSIGAGGTHAEAPALSIGTYKASENASRVFCTTE